MTRDEVIAAVPCTYCGAPIGERCRDGGRARRSCHVKRIGLAEMMEGWRDPPPSPFARKARRENHRIRSGG